MIRAIKGLPLAAALGALVLCCPRAARSAGSVAICDESHLKSALAGGGLVTFSCSGTITLTSRIVISTSTIIAGPGVTISGANKVQLFAVASGISLTLGSLTLVSGFSSGGGGAILNAGGSVTASYCTFNNNAAGGSSNGGAILNGGTLIVSDGSFGQPTGGGNTAASGGAIANMAGGNLNVVRSTFANNTVTGNPGYGGAIYNLGTLAVVNSTFYANGAANAFGGNIYSSNATTAAVSSSTIANGAASQGGNLYYAGTGGLVLTDSIVAYVPPNPSVTPPNCFGAITDGTGNLTWPNSDNSCGTKGIGNPMLGPLANNSGPTATMALMAGSAAIKNANASCPTGDQRGILRPAFPCDTGAYEYTPVLIAVAAPLQEPIHLPGCNCIANKKIVEPLADSLDPRYWLPDGNHLYPQTGAQVFNLHEQAVNALSDLITDQTQLIYITTLVFVDRSLALIAMNDKGCNANSGSSVSASVTGSVCAQAAAALAAGDASASNGAYGAAIDHYQSAWQLTKP
ncbi:exported hypothetical protein [Candidatus Sulfopaludibacter sp. SbA4]|nr:exported hypothetical protein [Candidatus Sulfopaludibacter sp. SbA4]